MSSHSLQNEGYYAFKWAAINVLKRRLRVTQNTEITWADWVTAPSSVTRGVPGTERAGAFADAVVMTENLALENKLKWDRKGMWRQGCMAAQSVSAYRGFTFRERKATAWVPGCIWFSESLLQSKQWSWALSSNVLASASELKIAQRYGFPAPLLLWAVHPSLSCVWIAHNVVDDYFTPYHVPGGIQLFTAALRWRWCSEIYH